MHRQEFYFQNQMEDVVRSFLSNIISDITPAQQLGLNRHYIDIKHETFDAFVLYKGNNHYVWCYQDGQSVVLQRYGYSNTIINLADPNSREKIIQVFRDAD